MARWLVVRSWLLGVGALVAAGACVDEVVRVEERPAGAAMAVAGSGFVNHAMMTTQKPRLWMPFRKGTSHRCSQGTSDPYSHDKGNTKYALDFRTSEASDEQVVAALAGRVAYVKADCAEGNQNCGGGFGNQVRVDHGGGYYTLYAHLSSVAVKVDDEVGRGQLLGREGNTGISTADHLHFSLHQGDPKDPKVAPSVPYSIRNRDISEGPPFMDREAEDHVCGPSMVGHTYESDNVCIKVNDTRQKFKQITNETPYLGEACEEGDVDYFRFSGGGGSFSATITSTPESMFDCSCAIQDAGGRELQPGGPEGYFRDDDHNGAEGCACSLANASAGSYLLKIYADMPGFYRFEKSLP